MLKTFVLGVVLNVLLIAIMAVGLPNQDWVAYVWLLWFTAGIPAVTVLAGAIVHRLARRRSDEPIGLLAVQAKGFFK